MKSKLFIIFLSLFGAFSLLTYWLEYLENNGQDSYVAFLWVVIMPGFFLYVIVTGDIHGWQSGPIGQSGRVLVTGIGSSVFWTLMYYLITRRMASKR